MPSLIRGSGTRDIIWLGKHFATPVLYAASASSALAALGSKAYDWESSLDVGLGAGTNCAIFILPIYLCVAFGLANDAQIEQSRLLGGWSVDVQRLRMVAAICALAFGAVLVAVLVACGLALAVPNPSPNQHVEIGLTRSAVRLALTALAAVVISSLVAFGRGLLPDVCAGCGVVLCHVLIQFTPEVAGQTGLKLLWPFTGATAVSEAGSNYSSAQGLLAAAALLVWTVVGIVRLGAAPVANRLGSRSEPRRSAAVGRSRIVFTLGCLVAVAVVPALVRATLPAVPPSARPSMLLQRSQHAAPEQVAEELFDDLQRGEVGEAQRHAVASRPTLVAELPRRLYVPGPGQTFRLERLIGIDRAEVTAFLVAGTYHVCMVNQRGTWKVEAVGAERC